MMFAHPWMLLLLIAPVLLVWWEWRRRGRPVVLPLDHSAGRARPWLERFIKCANVLTPLLLAVCILILAGPQRLTQPKNERVLTNIEFVLDVSGSMIAPFGGGTRADKAFEAIVDFTSFRKGDAFGLTIFGTDVVHWVPLTQDLTALRLAAPFLRPEKMPPHMGGTRIAHALQAVQKILRSREEGDRMVVLISDGQSFDLNSGVAQKLGEELSRDNITVFYIHAADGSPQEETYTLANLTGGRAFSAGDPQSLRDVFERIDSMSPAKLKPSMPQPADWFWPFVTAGLSLLGLKVVSLFGLRFTPW
ncbi:MAG: VWA domain-containing protein [Verrucomicrobia bacterium]|nr:VWA domain-containing protein [Verrucomicrobiota bacterium]